MADSPDTPLRLRLRVILKLMAITAGVAALAIAFVYATGGAPSARGVEVKRVRVDDLGRSEARIVSWAGRPVIIVRLGASAQTAASGGRDRWRVFYGNDPRHGCLLRWAAGAGELQSRCADARYGDDGEPVGATRGPALRAPDHHITDDAVVVLGRN